MAEEKVREFKGGRRGAGPRPKLEHPMASFLRIMRYVMHFYPVHIILVVLAIFANVLCSVRGTWFMKDLIDVYIKPLLLSAQPDFSGLLHAIYSVAGFYLLGVVAVFIQNRLMIYVSQGTLMHMRNEMFTHMEKLPVSYFDSHPHGDIMSMYTNDIDTLRQMISQSLPQFLSSAVTIVSVFASMVMLSVPLTILTMVMVVIVLFSTKKATGLSGRYFLQQQKDLGMLNGYIEEMMEGQKVVKVFCHEKVSYEDFCKLNDQLFESAYNANQFVNLL